MVGVTTRPLGRTREETNLQREFHGRMFGSLYEWGRAREIIVDLTGEDSPTGLIGLDQMGHFGPNACTLVAERIAASVGAIGRPLVVAELGGGFGGASRYVVAELARLGVPVSTALAFELVAEHCHLAATINRSLDVSTVVPICADVADLPCRSGCLDAVFASGSVPHFANMGAVIAESQRVLQPGGTLVLTEEVSLLARDGDPDAEFFRRHPPGVFFFATLHERLAQLRERGFVGIDIENLTDWGIELLRGRLKALDLFYGTAEHVYGVPETEKIARQLEVTVTQYERGALTPAIITARAP